MKPAQEGDAVVSRIPGSALRERWIPWAGIALSHVVAGLVTTTCLVTVPLALFTLLFVGALIYAAATNGDPGGPLFYPVGALAIVLFGASCSLAVCTFGLATDLLRRLMSWPIWIPLIAAYVFAFVAALSISLVKEMHPLGAILTAAVIAIASIPVFATYWIPLTLSGASIRWLNRRLDSLLERRRSRRSAARSNAPQPTP